MSTVIHGTLRVQDLIPAFIEEVGKRRGMPVFGIELPEDDNDPWWECDDAIWTLEEMTEQLENLAPAGTYFGTHPGDASDFGFWPIEDERHFDNEIPVRNTA